MKKTRSYTINSDASFSRVKKRGAWAYYIKGEDFHVKSSGMFKSSTFIAGPIYAELRTFIKAIIRLNEVVPEADRKGTKLYVNCDCMFVIHVLSGVKIRAKHPINQTLINEARRYVQGYSVIPRHVKGHTGDLSTARAYVNDWCDQAVRLEMGRALYQK